MGGTEVESWGGAENQFFSVAIKKKKKKKLHTRGKNEILTAYGKRKRKKKNQHICFSIK